MRSADRWTPGQGQLPLAKADSEHEHDARGNPKPNVGKLAAAEAVGGIAVLPEFTAEEVTLSDWNDKVAAVGIVEACVQFRRARWRRGHRRIGALLVGRFQPRQQDLRAHVFNLALEPRASPDLAAVELGLHFLEIYSRLRSATTAKAASGPESHRERPPATGITEGPDRDRRVATTATADPTTYQRSGRSISTIRRTGREAPGILVTSSAN
jgi:hypothetical protein